MYGADLREAAVPSATGADDCHAPERNVRNDEMSNRMSMDVGLVIIRDVVWLTASLVTDRRRRRKGQRRTKSASARYDQHQPEVRFECMLNKRSDAW